MSLDPSTSEPETDETRRKRELVELEAKRAAWGAQLSKIEALRAAQSASEREARARPVKVVARDIASGFAHYPLRRLIQDLGRIDRDHLVNELMALWKADEDARGAGELAKPLSSMTPGQALLARHGLAE